VTQFTAVCTGGAHTRRCIGIDALVLTAAAMSTESSTTGSPLELDPQRLDSVIQKVLPFAGVADAFARRSVGKVSTLAMLGLGAAGWLCFACADTFDWSLTTVLIVFPLLAIPGALLWKMQRTLQATIGLPQRIRDTALGMAGKTAEYRDRFARRHPLDPTAQRPGLLQLWRTGKAVLEVKALGDKAQEIVSASAGAMVMANPLFLIVLAGALAAVFVLIGAAGIVGLAYVL
jgi:hypothetical protein